MLVGNGTVEIVIRQVLAKALKKKKKRGREERKNPKNLLLEYELKSFQNYS